MKRVNNALHILNKVHVANTQLSRIVSIAGSIKKKLSDASLRMQ